MATEEHKALALFLKKVHSSLRKASSEVGANRAWQDHCANKDVLKTYAYSMEKLATTHWEKNCANDSSAVVSRIQWAVDFCKDYFVNNHYMQFREKEINVCNKINIKLNIQECFSTPIKLIDVGSCYNPFRNFNFLDVLAIDLCPANHYVLQCDFLHVTVGLCNEIVGSKVKQLQHSYFDAVTFCFLLEYIPNSELRLNACEKAYSILKPGGLLLISTPDSKHVGANYKIMKCWRYTLAHIGFTRIKYAKEKHMHCMAFRKALNRETAVRWAKIHKEPYMELSIHIPQDFSVNEEREEGTKVGVCFEDFRELPFFEQ